METQTTKISYQAPLLLEIEIYTQHIQTQTVPVTKSMNLFEDFKVDEFFLDFNDF